MPVVMLVMFFQHVFTVIAIEITPDQVNMVSVVLGIIEFDQECFSLDAVIMWFAHLNRSGPSDKKFVCVVVYHRRRYDSRYDLSDNFITIAKAVIIPF